MIQTDDEVIESEPNQNVIHRRQKFHFDEDRCGADCIDVALVELTKAAFLRPIGSPYRLNLIALEESWEIVLVLRGHTGERHRQVVAQSEVGLPACLVLSTPQNLENEL